MQIDELEADLANAKAEANEYKRYSALYDSTKQELTAADTKIHDVETDLSDLQMQIKKLQHENDQLSMKARKMETFQRKSLKLEKENGHLARKLSNLEEISTEETEKDAETVNKLSADILAKDMRIEELEKALEESQL